MCDDMEIVLLSLIHDDEEYILYIWKPIAGVLSFNIGGTRVQPSTTKDVS